jgi:hypothetical protein
VRRIGVLAGLAGLVVLVSIGAPQRAPAQSLQLRDPASVPPSWQQFAKLVKYRFEEWTRADDEVTRRLRTYVQSRAGHDDGPPRALLVKAWVAADGKVEKVDFPALNDPQATEDLRAILVRGNIGEPPPPDMLQPLQLRVSLNLPK